MGKIKYEKEDTFKPSELAEMKAANFELARLTGEDLSLTEAVEICLYADYCENENCAGGCTNENWKWQYADELEQALAKIKDGAE